MRRNILIWLTLLFIAVTTPIISRASVVQSLSNPDAVAPGVKQVNTYTVKPGDTLWKLSRQLGIQISQLMSENHITNPRLLQIGKVLQYTTWNLPAGTGSSSSQNNGSSPATHVSTKSGRSSNPLQYAKVLYCTLTAYTAGPLSTGKSPGDPGYGITSTGQQAEQGVTVAVDPHIIPYGTKLYIPGVGYRVAEDTGGAIVGDHIDVFYNSRSTAVRFGVKYHQKVYVLPDWYHIPIG